MEELVECIVKSKLTVKAFVGRCFSIALGLFFILITMVVANVAPWALPFAFIFDLIVGFVVFFAFRNTNIEYEYDFFGGELTIDKIMSKAKRKRLRVLNFNNFEYMAPSDSKRFGNMDTMEYEYLNYSAHDIEEKTYIAMFHGEEKGTLYLEFSPNEELISLIRKLYPRKVYEE